MTIRGTFTYELAIEASSAHEADAIVRNLLTGKTFAHEVGARVTPVVHCRLAELEVGKP